VPVPVVSIAKCCGSTFGFFNYDALVVSTVSAPCKMKYQLLQYHHESLVGQLDSGAIFVGRGKIRKLVLLDLGFSMLCFIRFFVQ
jgi:hypothetical protein